MRPRAAALVLPLLLGASRGLDVAEKSLDGTAAEADGLSQKQLALLRYIAHLTFMTDGDADPWSGWNVNGKIPGGPMQPGIESLRYQVSNDAYAVAVLAQRTPAYTEVHSRILVSAARRMIRPELWPYALSYYGAEHTHNGSDPVRFKNIMYSGHLMKTIALSELISGDMSLSEGTWDFVYGTSKSTYNLTRLMRAVYDQMYPPGGEPPEWSPAYDGGGVPCEPPTIFLICNNFPHNAFHVHDGVHGTNYKDSDARWQETVRKHGIIKPRLKDSNYFKLLEVTAAKTWSPMSVAGGDAWYLAWVRGWWNETDPADKELMYNGYEHFAQRPSWTTDPVSKGTYFKGMPKAYNGLGTSFFPLIERQFWTPSSGLARRSEDIMRYFEQFGELADMDGDGVKESYRYVEPDNAQTHPTVTGSLLAAMAFPNDGSANDVVKDLFQATPPFYARHASEPRISHADYPNVMVPVARYDAEAQVLRFQLVAGDRALGTDTTDVELANTAGLKAVTLDGKAYDKYVPGKARGATVLTAPAPTNTPQVWEVTF